MGREAEAPSSPGLIRRPTAGRKPHPPQRRYRGLSFTSEPKRRLFPMTSNAIATRGSWRKGFREGQTTSAAPFLRDRTSWAGGVEEGVAPAELRGPFPQFLTSMRRHKLRLLEFQPYITPEYSQQQTPLPRPKADVSEKRCLKEVCRCRKNSQTVHQ